MNVVQPHDWDRVRLLIDASIQAHRAFGGNPAPSNPGGYSILDTWTGVDSIFGKDKAVEVYGLVLRSVTSPYRYVFAFRGTASIEDLIDDLGAEDRAFVPAGPSVAVPPDVRVESGFWDVYTTDDGATPSMQRQVFALLDRYAASDYPIDELWITGHSLGAALSTLFSLDVALCRPAIAALQINFGSPRVGNAAFVTFYQQQAAQQLSTSRTLRVQNVLDLVPRMPPEHLGYRHVTDAVLLAFHKHETLPLDLDFIHRHASASYQAVVQCAATSPDGVCLNAALPVPGEGYALTSVKADPAKAGE